MADTIRSRAALAALLPDNVTGEISPQDARDVLISSVLRNSAYKTGIGNFGTTDPAKMLEVLDSAAAQLRLTHTPATKYCDFMVDTNHDLTITPSSNGQIKLQPTVDSTDFFQVLDADGGTPILSVDSTNERIGVRTSAPGMALDVAGGSIRLTEAVGVGTDTLVHILGSTDDGLINIYQNNTIAISLNGNGKSYFNGGSVGIGDFSSVNPDGTLHVMTASAGAVTAHAEADDIIIENSTTAGLSILTPDANYAVVYLGSPSDNKGALLSYSYNAGLFHMGTDLAGASVVFLSGAGTEAARIDSSQNVVIGHTAAEGRFQVVKADAFPDIYFDSYTADAGYSPRLFFRHSHNNTLGTKTTTLTGEVLGQIWFYGVDSGGNFDNGAQIYAIQDGAAGVKLPTNVVIQTSSSTAANTNQFVLHNDGNVGINTDAPDAKFKVVASGANLLIGYGGTDNYFDGANNIFRTFAGVETARVTATDFRPGADDTFYLGKNDDDSPFAWKGVILKDTTDGKYYRIEVTNGAVDVIDLTD